ncbi:S-adenosylmethionine mitochondrial carrier protein homolog [Condylostylus longicornis]|uniref:S-adenosylmethionine mitochondrial carrier protein homolog n=1 Tax=Condylostylus longicornis TaxID=2530218 RepID=UPI00244DDAEB|nr:S-adenosylmethionine mitochondrial carrier protein homolog [Condylostylus longicornis]
MLESKYLTSLISGGVAGLFVDISLFPIDTIKTRLQSEKGFWRSGGFKAVYKGLGPVAAGSAPTAALFFCTYETIKYHVGEVLPEFKNSPYLHMFAASLAEVIACTIRVPVEIAKQRRQVSLGNEIVGNRSSLQILWLAYKNEGFCKGLYRGYGTTVLREIPFSFIQFPLWEYLKFRWCDWTGYEDLTPWSVALCGAIAGGISAGITTPLDVAKTRVMLAEQNSVNKKKLNIRNILRGIYKEKGLRGLFSGFVPRVTWITIGGAIFFGAYDLTTRILSGKDIFGIKRDTT